MSFKAYEIYKEYEPDKYKTSIQKKTEKALKEAKREGLVPPVQEITAINPEGGEISFNLEQIKKESTNLFKNLNLRELEEEIEGIEINLTPEQEERIRELAKEGFDRFYLFPSPEVQNNNLSKIKEETEKHISGLADKDQYSKKGTWFSDTVQPNFPDKIQTINRPPNKPYLLFVKDTPEVDEATKNKTPDELRQEFKQKNLTGLTLAEYLIFQRNHTEKNKNHPDHKYVTWLLDSEIPQQGGPARVLLSYWYPEFHQVRVDSYFPSHHSSSYGARSSAIFEI